MSQGRIQGAVPPPRPVKGGGRSPFYNLELSHLSNLELKSEENKINSLLFSALRPARQKSE